MRRYGGMFGGAPPDERVYCKNCQRFYMPGANIGHSCAGDTPVDLSRRDLERWLGADNEIHQ